MEKAFEHARKRRKLHEYTLTSRGINDVHYGSPALANKKHIWPPFSSDMEPQKSPEVPQTIFSRQLSQVADQESSITPPSKIEQANLKFGSENLYEPLREGRLIRLLEIKPGKYNDELNFLFHYEDMQKSCLAYEALSYVWGVDDDFMLYRQEQTKRIVRCNGHKLLVSISLEKALRGLRLEYASRVIWVDAICINQEDIQERGHQVSLMSTIYKQARRVVVWLAKQVDAKFEDVALDTANARGERSFGAICDVVNHWLSGQSSDRKASYIVASNSCKGDGRQFSNFRMDSFSITTSRDPEKLNSSLENSWPWSKIQAMQRRKMDQDKRSDSDPGESGEQDKDKGLHSSEQDAQASHFWHSIADLFECTWFWRLWVFQEIVLACAAIVKWGHNEIDWKWIGLAAAILRTNYHGICRSMKLGGVYNAYLMFRSSGFSDLPPLKFKFLQLLRLTRQLEVTDERDRIYGLLGITTEDNDPDDSRLFLKADYTIEKTELWRRLAVKVMANANNLSLLSSVQYQTGRFENDSNLNRQNQNFSKTKLPSWIPQWNHVFRASLSPWDSQDNFSAARDLPLKLIQSAEPDSLCVQGLEIGMIAHTLSFMWHELDVSLLWSTHLHKFFHSETGLRVLARTLTAGRNSYGSVIQEDDSTSLADFAKFILSLPKYEKERLSRRSHYGLPMWAHSYDLRKNLLSLLDTTLLRNLAAGGDAARFAETALTFCESRRLFLTVNGYLGLGPSTLREGDILCVLAGSDLPFILRPASEKHNEALTQDISVKEIEGESSQPSHYYFVGECYVEGLMKGEAVEASNSERGLIGPVPPEFVEREIFEMAGRPLPNRRLRPQDASLADPETLREISWALRQELRLGRSERRQIRWFDIR